MNIDGVKSMATIKDIAKMAGVTPSTVSRVLNNNGGYNEKTKNKIEKIANLLHYQKNEHASSLVSKKNRLIGVIITDGKTSFSSQIIDSIENTAYTNNIRILMAHCGSNDPKRLHFCLEMMFGQKVNGIISISVQFDTNNLNYLHTTNIPFTSICVDVPGYASIKINDTQASYDGTNYLIKSGYKKIAFVAASYSDPQTGMRRILGYKNALRDAKMAFNEDYIIKGNFSFDAGKIAAHKLMTCDDQPDAIFAASDDSAAGVISYAYEHKIRIPEDLAILGFDDSNIARIVSPSLTTIKQPFEEMGKIAVNKIINYDTSKGVLVSHQIMIRTSV